MQDNNLLLKKANKNIIAKMPYSAILIIYLLSTSNLNKFSYVAKITFCCFLSENKNKNSSDNNHYIKNM